MLRERSKCFPSRAYPFSSFFDGVDRLKPHQAIKTSISMRRRFTFLICWVFKLFSIALRIEHAPYLLESTISSRHISVGISLFSRIINIIKWISVRQTWHPLCSEQIHSLCFFTSLSNSPGPWLMPWTGRNGSLELLSRDGLHPVSSRD